MFCCLFVFEGHLKTVVTERFLCENYAKVVVVEQFRAAVLLLAVEVQKYSDEIYFP